MVVWPEQAGFELGVDDPRESIGARAVFLIRGREKETLGPGAVVQPFAVSNVKG